MKALKHSIHFSLLLLILTSYDISGQNSQNVQLLVEIEGIQTIKGTLYIALFSEPYDFPNVEKTKIKDFKTVEHQKETFTFSVPEGTYAITVFQDLDEDKEFDKNFFGVPKEPYCLSNNVKPKLSTPDFEDCAFTVSTNTTINLKLIN
ncbi:DUF2141 domain-containing protein [Aquimarina sp. U1-2]|uniref:DUF2141 domain-containing protein n=1 Tax=Aquimarina sp. U1-2 TaxID=2823141 RepID=UPI001AECB0EC|nr:DUF2141 domain-containing protein [Aquimarina sp. U1-2]MBP2833800.1 DUF2141 domain-containing protein [Aquimarina sp. U1-2]